MNSISLVTFTHTDYKDIWNIVFDSVRSMNLPCETILAVNSQVCNEDITQSPYSRIITYDDRKQYPERIQELLESIQTPYIFLAHDIDVFLEFDTHKFTKIVDAVEKFQLDRCALEMFLPNSLTINTSEFTLTSTSTPNLSPHFLTPYDVGPSIWKVSTLKELMQMASGCTYRTIETNHQVQSFLSKKKVFGIAPHPSYQARYQIGRPFPSAFTCVHILIRGQWSEPHWFQDCQQYFERLLVKYKIDCSIRGIMPGHDGMNPKRLF